LVSIADAQGAPPVALVLNRATPERTEAVRSLADTLSVAFAGAIPEDDGVRRADLAGSPVAAYDRRGPALRAVERLAGRLRLMAEGARR
jgi:CO dehydrogenase nickel-insertion accessory protein CooC1